MKYSFITLNNGKSYYSHAGRDTQKFDSTNRDNIFIHIGIGAQRID